MDAAFRARDRKPGDLAVSTQAILFVGEAKSLELRVAISLGRLWAKEGKQGETLSQAFGRKVLTRPATPWYYSAWLEEVL